MSFESRPAVQKFVQIRRSGRCCCFVFRLVFSVRCVTCPPVFEPLAVVVDSACVRDERLCEEIFKFSSPNLIDPFFKVRTCARALLLPLPLLCSVA